MSLSLSCPLPLSQYPQVLLAHGGGGRLMNQLIETMFLPAFGGGETIVPHDASVLVGLGDKLAFSTDSYVVQPLFFPGGDIGKLAVYGTVNDLLMAGATPRYLSVGFILEEGLPMETLWRVVQSMAAAAQEVGVRIVTGDTKVVDRGKGDGIFINTAGVGTIAPNQAPIGPMEIQPGDVLIINGDLGRHGMAIMAEREGLGFESPIVSDCASLWEPVQALLTQGISVHCLRDLTRGGLASALNEIAQARGLDLTVAETQIPITAPVQGACEILGFDPLYVANEGRFVAFVPAAQGATALNLLAPYASADAPPAIVGHVESTPGGRVILKSQVGTRRFLEMLSGEQLPRIC